MPAEGYLGRSEPDILLFEIASDIFVDPGPGVLYLRDDAIDVFISVYEIDVIADIIEDCHVVLSQKHAFVLG